MHLTIIYNARRVGDRVLRVWGTRLTETTRNKQDIRTAPDPQWVLEECIRHLPSVDKPFHWLLTTCASIDTCGEALLSIIPQEKTVIFPTYFHGKRLQIKAAAISIRFISTHGSHYTSTDKVRVGLFTYSDSTVCIQYRTFHPHSI